MIMYVKCNKRKISFPAEFLYIRDIIQLTVWMVGELLKRIHSRFEIREASAGAGIAFWEFLSCKGNTHSFRGSNNI